jgi:integrase
VSVLRTFINDLIFWQWPDRPARPLLHISDLPRLLEHVPRALTPTDDLALMAAVARLEDVAAHGAIRIFRGTALRLGELLDLEIDCLLDFSGRGTWLRVPVGKFDTERAVPLDEETLSAFDADSEGFCTPVPIEFVHPFRSFCTPGEVVTPALA